MSVPSRFASRLFAALTRPAVALALIAVASAPLPASAQQAQGFQTSVPGAVLIDFETGTILYEKDADKRFAPGTLTKVMTADVVFSSSRPARSRSTRPSW